MYRGYIRCSSGSPVSLSRPEKGEGEQMINKTMLVPVVCYCCKRIASHKKMTVCSKGFRLDSRQAAKQHMLYIGRCPMCSGGNNEA